MPYFLRIITITPVFIALYLALMAAVHAFSAVSRAPLDPPTRFLTKKLRTVNKKQMAYVEVGIGDPIVFLHSNPTSSYIWRNVMPQLEGKGRLIAPDLIGMGDSGKLDFSSPNRYTFLEHCNYLFQLLEQLGVKENVTFVVHDWGSALGFLWAYYNRHKPNATKAIAFMEAIVAPLPSLASMPKQTAEMFRQLRSPAGEEFVLQSNATFENVIPGGILRKLTNDELAEYRRPFAKPGEDRRPILTWTRQLPIGGIPSDVDALVRTYAEWLSTSEIPKLFINAEPGSSSQQMRPVVRNWQNLKEITVEGLHFIQEDSPCRIGMAIAQWLSQIQN